jgi:O-antigen/teichoic acid export membrane protein
LFDESGRTLRLLTAVRSQVAAKGVLFLVNVVSIPLLIRYLGARDFGVWTIVTTTLTVLFALDFGVANSLTNFISEAYAREDPEHAGRYSTTALGITLTVAAAIGCGAWLSWPYIRWERVFGMTAAGDRELLSRAAAVALGLALMALPARLGAKILGGYQELNTANKFAVVGAVGNLAAILVLVQLHAPLPALIAGSYGAVVAADLTCLLWLIYLHKPWLRPKLSHLNRAVAGRMIRSGASLFMLQVAGLMVFDSDNLIISHYLGPAEVAPYSVTWQLVGYAAALHALLLPALWPAFSEALVRGDIAWVRRIFWRIMLITMGIATAAAAVYAILGRRIIALWASNAAVPNETLMLLMCAWVLISTFMNNTVSVLLAKGAIRLQSWLALGVGVLNIPLSIWLVQHLGSAGVILGTILAYLIVLVVPQTVLTWRVLYEMPP